MENQEKMCINPSPTTTIKKRMKASNAFTFSFHIQAGDNRQCRQEYIIALIQRAE